MTPALLDYIRRRRACAQGMAIAEQHETLTEAIRACPLEYKLWALGNLMPQRIRVGIAAHIVRHTPLADGRTVYDLMTDERSRAALDVCDRYAAGAATDDDLTAAWAAARDAAASAAWDAAESWQSAYLDSLDWDSIVNTAMEVA